MTRTGYPDKSLSSLWQDHHGVPEGLRHHTREVARLKIVVGCCCTAIMVQNVGRVENAVDYAG